MKKTLKEQSDTFGVSLNSVYRWEHDLTSPKRPVLKKMADYYEVPLEWLLRDSSDEEDSDFGGAVFPESNDEQKLLRMYRKLSGSNKYKILGYVERVYVETLDEMNPGGIVKE
jgi:transcriptional regulator with XRE-family HTH domain